MTIAERARAHWLWKDYVQAREHRHREAVRSLSLLIATDLGLSEWQRLRNLPKIARQSPVIGRPRKPRSTRCPYCAHELVIEVP